MEKQGSSSASDSSPSREASPLEGVIEDMQSRIKRLERWHAINTVISIYFPRFLFHLDCYFLFLQDCHLYYSDLHFDHLFAGAMDIFYVCLCRLFPLSKKTQVILDSRNFIREI